MSAVALATAVVLALALAIVLRCAVVYVARPRDGRHRFVVIGNLSPYRETILVGGAHTVRGADMLMRRFVAKHPYGLAQFYEWHKVPRELRVQIRGTCSAQRYGRERRQVAALVRADRETKP